MIRTLTDEIIIRNMSTHGKKVTRKQAKQLYASGKDIVIVRNGHGFNDADIINKTCNIPFDSLVPSRLYALYIFA